MNRLDKMVVFHPLSREQLEEVLRIELSQVQQRLLEAKNGQFLFRVTEAGREFLLQEGSDQRYGARHLNRAIERHVVFPLAKLLATEQVRSGDTLCIDWDSRIGGLVFWKENEVFRSVPRPRVVPPQTAKAAGVGGRSVEVTSFTKAHGAGNNK